MQSSPGPITRGTVMGVATGKAGTYNGISRSAGDLIEKIYYNSTGLVRAFYANGTFNSQHPNRSSYLDYGWCGMPRSRFTGLYHTHYREYDAIHGRWLNEDPAGYADGLNLYNNYAGVNGVDPLGLDRIELDIDGDLIKVYYVDEPALGFGEDSEPEYLGVFDPETGEVILSNGRCATLKMISDHAAGITDWDDFMANRSYSSSWRENAQSGSLAPSMIGLKQQYKSLGYGEMRLSSIDDIVTATDMASDICKDLLWAYATMPLEFAEVFKAVRSAAAATNLLEASNYVNAIKVNGKYLKNIAAKASQSGKSVSLSLKGLKAKIAGAAAMLGRKGKKSKPWLQYWEGRGLKKSIGHVIAQHVGKTDQQLIKRVAKKNGPKFASSFLNQSVAEEVISAAINYERNSMNSWLRKAKPGQRFPILFEKGTKVIGRTAVRGKKGLINQTNATVVLQALGNGKYHILTAFPGIQ